MLISSSQVCFRVTTTDLDRTNAEGAQKMPSKSKSTLLLKPDTAGPYAILSCDNERKAVDPLAASSRNACNAVAARWYQCMPKYCLSERISTSRTMKRRIPGAALRIPKNARSSSKAGQDLDAIYPQTCSQVKSEQAFAPPCVFHQVSLCVVPKNG